MNGFSREAFRDWWTKEVNFVDPYDAAFHAWDAALEWYGDQLRTLEALEVRAKVPDDLERLRDNYHDQRKWLIPGDSDTAEQSRIQEL